MDHHDHEFTVVLASPRGWCAGVERAVDTVVETLRLHGPPVYVRKQIVHNLHVVRDLEAQGAIFVDDERDVPEGATVVLSAHGVAPTVYANSAQRRLNVVDATCPLVTKVHKEAKRYAKEGYTIILIGHEGHEEVVGTMGEAPDSIVLVQDEAEVDTLVFPDDAKLAYITQTTLSVDETASIVERLKQRFPQVEGPAKDDICYATSNRQLAVKELVEQAQLVLVIGSGNSSNTNRLVDVAREAGAASYRIENASEIDPSWLDGIDVVGVTSGASAPESLVREVCEWLRQHGATNVEPPTEVDEGVHFMLPTELRVAMAQRDAQLT